MLVVDSRSLLQSSSSSSGPMPALLSLASSSVQQDLLVHLPAFAPAQQAAPSHPHIHSVSAMRHSLAALCLPVMDPGERLLAEAVCPVPKAVRNLLQIPRVCALLNAGLLTSRSERCPGGYPGRPLRRSLRPPFRTFDQAESAAVGVVELANGRLKSMSYVQSQIKVWKLVASRRGLRSC